MKTLWYEKGIRFECQGSGKCCLSRDEYGYVYLTLNDRRNMAKSLGISTQEFTKTYCNKTDGFFHLKQESKSDNCLFLKNNRCEVYESRPMQCKTWPFWPDVMDAKTWKAEVANFCPGVGKGKLYSLEEIEEEIEKQNRWEHRLQIEND